MHLLKTSTLLAAVALGTSGNLFAQQAAPVAPVAKSAAVAPAPAPAAVARVPAAKPAPTPASAPAPAAAPAAYVPVPTPEQPRFAVSVGVGLQSVQFKDDNTQDPYLYGATVSVSGFLSKTRPGLKNVRWTADAGFYFGDYTDTILHESGSYLDPDLRLTQSDVLTRKNDQFNLPVLATLAYELELGKNFNLRLGPSLGFTFVSIESSFYGYNQISNENDPNDPNSNGKTNEIRLKKSGSKAIFTYGATAGATWNITKRLHADFQYRLTGNEAVDFGFGRDFGKSIIHQANLSLGWRF